MAFTRPSLTDLIARIESDLQTKLGGTGAPLRRSAVGILARVMAGVIHSLYGFLNWVSNQLFVTSAESEQLDRHGVIWGIDRKPATFSVGVVRFLGDPNEIIPINTIMQNVAEVQFITTAQGETNAEGFADIQIKAMNAGADGNLAAGVVLTLLSPIPFVNTETIVQGAGTTGGAYIESDEDYRQRILFRIQNTPQGGAKADYVIWATQADNVSDAWCFPLQFGAGTVLVTCANYTQNPPVVTDLSQVQAIIEEKRPVTAAVTVLSVVESFVKLTVKISPNNQTTRDTVTAQIKDLLRRRGIPAGTISKNNLGEAIGTSGGVNDFEIVDILQDNISVQNIENNVYQISVLDLITFTDL
jgi:uncharacterized phage protein gp47/JayE